MLKGRLEAFSDAVLAIIITIMVLELEVPHGSDLSALRPLVPVALSYVLSVVYLGIYWKWLRAGAAVAGPGVYCPAASSCCSITATSGLAMKFFHTKPVR
jgi:hypothetical protein